MLHQHCTCICLDSSVVNVMDSHPCDQGSTPAKANHIPVLYAVNNIQFRSNESSAEMV